jgi:hypothetical protein
MLNNNYHLDIVYRYILFYCIRRFRNHFSIHVTIRFRQHTSEQLISAAEQFGHYKIYTIVLSTVAGLKFGICTPWRWRNHAETCCSNVCTIIHVCDIAHLFDCNKGIYWSEIYGVNNFTSKTVCSLVRPKGNNINSGCSRTRCSQSFWIQEMCSLTLAEMRVGFQRGIISFAIFLHVFSSIRLSLSFRCLVSSFLP